MKKLKCIHSNKWYFTVGKEYRIIDGDFVLDDAAEFPWFLEKDDATGLFHIPMVGEEAAAVFRVEEDEKPEKVERVVCTGFHKEFPYFTVGKEYEVIDGRLIVDDCDPRMPWEITWEGNVALIYVHEEAQATFERVDRDPDQSKEEEKETDGIKVKCVKSESKYFKVNKEYTIKKNPKDSAWNNIFDDYPEYGVAPRAEDYPFLPGDIVERLYYSAKKSRSGKSFVVNGEDFVVVFKEVK